MTGTNNPDKLRGLPTGFTDFSSPAACAPAI